jgi:hypothetical protein
VRIDGQVEKFNNLRSQMWWQAWVDLQNGSIGIAIADRNELEVLVRVRTAPRAGRPQTRGPDNAGRAAAAPDASVFVDQGGRARPAGERPRMRR